MGCGCGVGGKSIKSYKKPPFPCFQNSYYTEPLIAGGLLKLDLLPLPSLPAAARWGRRWSSACTGGPRPLLQPCEQRAQAETQGHALQSRCLSNPGTACKGACWWPKGARPLMDGWHTGAMPQPSPLVTESVPCHVPNSKVTGENMTSQIY